MSKPESPTYMIAFDPPQIEPSPLQIHRDGVSFSEHRLLLGRRLISEESHISKVSKPPAYCHHLLQHRLHSFKAARQMS